MPQLLDKLAAHADDPVEVQQNVHDDGQGKGQAQLFVDAQAGECRGHDEQECGENAEVEPEIVFVHSLQVSFSSECDIGVALDGSDDSPRWFRSGLDLVHFG